MTNKTHSVLYTGVTSNLVRRVYEHQNHLVNGFTADYNVTKLVYYAVADTMETAIVREKQIKGWSRRKKMMLIEEFNPAWKDIYGEIAS